MKHAKQVVESVVVKCPHCENELAEPQSGSLFWTVDDVWAYVGKGRARQIKCDCGETCLVAKLKRFS